MSPENGPEPTAQFKVIDLADAEDDRVLDEAEALLDIDGRRERLDRAVAGLQSGKVQPAGHATARDRIGKRTRDRRTR